MDERPHAAEPSLEDRKRLRLDCDVDPFVNALQRDPLDVFTGGTDGTGFLSVVVFMVWPIKNGKARFNARATSPDDPTVRYRFDMEFSGPCAHFFEKELRLRVQDQLDVALMGAQVVKLRGSAGPEALSMLLKWDEGVSVRFRRKAGVDVDCIVNVWKLTKEARLKEEQESEPPFIEGFSVQASAKNPTIEWNMSPEPSELPSITTTRTAQSPQSRPSMPRDTSHDVEMSTTSSGMKRSDLGGSAPLDRRELQTPSSSRGALDRPPSSSKRTKGDPTPDTLAIAKSKAVQPSRPESNAAPGIAANSPATLGPTLSEAAQKRLKKRERKKLKKRQQALNNADVAGDAAAGETAVDAGLGDADRGAGTSGSDPTPAVVQSEDATDAQRPLAAADPPPPAVPTLSAGFKNMKAEVYTPISQMQCRSQYHLIGVSTANSGLTLGDTSSGEWKLCLRLIDPSKYDPQAGLDVSEFVINCFTAKYPGWLPVVEYGDVVIVRDLKTLTWQSEVRGIGYKDKLRFAIYDPSTHTSHHGPPTDPPAPRSEGLAQDGRGVVFSPFYEARAEELDFCKRMKDWWESLDEVKRRKEETKIIVQIGEGGPHEGVRQFGGRPVRQHRLISEAGPHVEPNGFFDCTVEVVHGYASSNDTFTLYVTDYTSNSQMRPVATRWCDPLLADRILTIEMWEEARNYAKDNMEPGEFYFLGNARMKVGSDGYAVGTISEVHKSRRLLEKDAQRDGPLKELLRRKKEWKESCGSLLPRNEFEHLLFKDIDPDSTTFLNCTAVVLHVVTAAEYCLYVTDYTEPPVAAALPRGAFESWAKGLDKYVFKISLKDGQENVSKYVKPGQLCSIQRLRVINSVVEGQLHGRVGGGEMLIRRIHADWEESEAVMALLMRRNQWQHAYQAAADPKHATRSTKYGPHKTIAQIKNENKLPDKFRLVARVVDFAPFDVRDFVVSKCSGCQEELKPPAKTCAQCYDEPVEHFFQFFFALQDETGERLKICVSDEDVCDLLRCLRPVNLHDDPTLLRVLETRLKPFVGNLFSYYGRMERGDREGLRAILDTPLLSFAIDSRLGFNGKPAYGLIKCTPLRQCARN